MVVRRTNAGSQILPVLPYAGTLDTQAKITRAKKCEPKFDNGPVYFSAKIPALNVEKRRMNEGKVDRTRSKNLGDGMCVVRWKVGWVRRRGGGPPYVTQVNDTL